MLEIALNAKKTLNIEKKNQTTFHQYQKQGTNVAHNIMGGLQIIAMFHL